jgi:hypothetical protein
MKIPLKSLNIEIGELKNVEKSIKQKLMKHYQELLYNGKEIRNEGLIWIIKAIWRLGENVPMSFMPTFLDFNAIKYLFNMARLSIELEAKKKFIIELRTKLKNEVNNFIKEKEKENENNKSNNSINIRDDNRKKSNKKKKRYIFKTDLLFKNKKLTHSSSQPKYMKTFYHLNKDYNNIMKDDLMNDNEESFKGSFREIEKMLEDNGKDLIFVNLPAVNHIKNLEKKIKQIENDIKNMKKYEITRIFKEYIDNDYENRYNASIDVVLGALIGEHSRNIQVNNFHAFKKGHLDEIKNIRFYEFDKRNGWIS